MNSNKVYIVPTQTEACSENMFDIKIKIDEPFDRFQS